MKVKPLWNKIIIEKDDIPEEVITESGLIIPDKDGARKMSVQTGVVVDVGPGSRNQSGEFMTPVVKKGDRIVFNHHAVFMMTIPQGNQPPKHVLYVPETEIIAVITEEE